MISTDDLFLLEMEIEAAGVVDPAWYLEQYPDVRLAGIDPVMHFARHGIHESRQPNPFFTGRWYKNVSALEDSVADLANPPSPEEIALSGLVDRDWYLAEYRDVAAAKADPVRHYVKNGITEKRRPNALFSRSWYDTKHPEVATSGLDSALHYVRQGSAKGFDPHPLFDSSFYLANQPGVARTEALADFLRQRHAGNLVPSMRLPSPPETIRRYPETIQNRIRVSPVLTGLPAIHYLSAHLRTGNEPDNGPRTLADFAGPDRNPLHQVGGSLRQSDIGVIVEMERLKQRLVADYSRRPQDELVSVIMPTRNRLGTIVDAINSVIVQSYGNWELMIVDDAGDCDLETLIASYGDKRIRLLRHDVRQGEGASRNTGLRNASGTAIVHLDDDDQFDPHIILLSLNAMRDADRRMFYCAQTVWQGFEELTMVGKRFLGILYHDFDRERLEQGNYLSISVVMHDRDITDIIGEFDEELTHLVDWDFFLRMTEVETPARLPVPLHHYYQARTADSVTANNPVEINVTRIRAKLAERLSGTRIAQESKM